MSDEMLRLVIGGVLLLHGVGHGGALGALIWLRYRPDSNTGDWLAARSWVAPSLSPEAAAQVAGAFWIVSLAGFAVSALSFWGIVLPDDIWRPVATGSAVVSMVGILAFLGTWPMFNTLAALGVNVAVLTAVVWLRWPPQALFTG